MKNHRLEARLSLRRLIHDSRIAIKERHVKIAIHAFNNPSEMSRSVGGGRIESKR